jgi:hypothetical protein
VYFVHQVPPLSYSIGYCTAPSAIYKMLGWSLEESFKEYCVGDRVESVENYFASYKAAVSLLLRDRPFVRILDPMPLFCPGPRCLATLNGQMMYRDNVHLNRFGSEFVAKKLLPVTGSSIHAATETIRLVGRDRH